MNHPWIRTGVVLVLLAVGASCSDDDSAAATSAGPTEPPTRLSADASSEDMDDGASTTSQARTEPATALLAAPAAFTVCLRPGTEVVAGTETIERRTGFTWNLVVESISDPRLDGEWYMSSDYVSYSVAGTDDRLHLQVESFRIENQEGAWQGSRTNVNIPDVGESALPLILIGGGAYQGFTAILASVAAGAGGDCPNAKGYILNGSVPAPPVPAR